MHETLHICIMCGRDCITPTKLKDHVKHNHKNNPNRCPRCPDHPPFASYVEHEGHVNKHHKGLFAYQCMFCPEYFDHRTLLLQHKIELHPHEKKRHQKSYAEDSQKYPCPQCGGLFRNVDGHIQTQHTARNWKCDQCPSTFGTEKGLRTHKVTHKVSPCPDCGLLFNEANLSRHQRIVHTPNDLKPYKCSTCQKGFLRPYLLKKHMVLHTGEKPYKCKLCSNAYADSSNLAAHVKSSHMGIKRVYKNR